MTVGKDAAKSARRREREARERELERSIADSEKISQRDAEIETLKSKIRSVESQLKSEIQRIASEAIEKRWIQVENHLRENCGFSPGEVSVLREVLGMHSQDQAIPYIEWDDPEAWDKNDQQLPKIRTFKERTELLELDELHVLDIDVVRGGKKAGKLWDYLIKDLPSLSLDDE